MGNKPKKLIKQDEQETLEVILLRHLRTIKTRRERLRRYMYNLSPEQFNKMYTTQKGCCAICVQPLEQKYCVDHDHLTGIVRGLLCYRCNIRLAGIDDVLWLEKAFDYLKI